MPTGLIIRAQNLAGWKKKGEKAAKIFKSRTMTVALGKDVNIEMRKISREQFHTQGSAGAHGRWAPLSDDYAEWKHKAFPGKTILRLTDKLYRSMTRVRPPSRVRITSWGFQFWYGTKIPDYPERHQKGPGNFPQRRIIDPTRKQIQRMMRRIEKTTVRKMGRQPFVDKQKGKSSKLTRQLQQSIQTTKGGRV